MGLFGQRRKRKGFVCCLGWQRLGGVSGSASDVGPRALVLMFFNEMGPRGNQEQRVGYRCDGGQSRTPVVVLCEIQAIGTTWGP